MENKRWVVTVPLLVMVLAIGFLIDPASADEQNTSVHNHVTALTAPNLVCGDHLCPVGHDHENPMPIIPIVGKP